MPCFFRARRYDEAIRESQQALDLDPNFVNAYWWQGLAYAGKHDFPKAIMCLTKAISLNDGPLFRSLLGHVYGRAGERPKALRILEESRCSPKQRFVSPMDFAVVYAGLGDADSTFQWLEKAYQTRSRNPRVAAAYFDSVRSDPRYADLMNVWAYRSRPAERSARGASRKSTQEAARSMILRRLTLQPRTAS